MDCETCYCGKLKECEKCNNFDNKDRNVDGKCKVGEGSFCTCRKCGLAVRRKEI